MKIYKLHYNNKETAIADLIAKKVYNLDLTYVNGIQAVVEIGKIISKNAIIDKDFNIITEAEYFSGYAFDVMNEQEIDFGAAEIIVRNPKHSFAI